MQQEGVHDDGRHILCVMCSHLTQGLRCTGSCVYVKLCVHVVQIHIHVVILSAERAL
jgi:hypothetical protein